MSTYNPEDERLVSEYAYAVVAHTIHSSQENWEEKQNACRALLDHMARLRGKKGEPMTRYRVPVYFQPEPDGSYSVFAANLPGCASQGDTREEAERNIAEALVGVLRTYHERGEPVPWRDDKDEPFWAKVFHVIVEV